MKNGTGKIFLISSAAYEHHDPAREVGIQAMQAVLKHFSDIHEQPGCTLLEGSEVFLTESDGPAAPHSITADLAINRARKFCMCRFDRFGPSATRTDNNIAGIRITQIKSGLFCDAHACFLLITEVAIEYDADLSGNDVLTTVFRDHNPFGNLGLHEYATLARQQAIQTIVDLPPLTETGLTEDDIHFHDSNTLPFIMLADACCIEPALFGNEELMKAAGSGSALAHDYPGAFFHPGWNYTVACGLPHEVMLALLQIMIVAQAFYFSLGHMKSYFARELRRTVTDRHSIDKHHVDAAEDVRLAFYDLLANFNTCKNHLFPKYHDELNALMRRWHCDIDINDIKEYIELDIQSKNRIRNASIELQNKRQNQALTFIALIQIISIYGAFSDGFSLFADHRWIVFSVGTLTWIAALAIYFLVTRRR